MVKPVQRWESIASAGSLLLIATFVFMAAITLSGHAPGATRGTEWKDMHERLTSLSHGWAAWGEDKALLAGLRDTALRRVPLTITEIASDMRDIPAGSFTMGRAPGGGYGQDPAHHVTVKAFRLAAHLVTFDQYDSFAVETNREPPFDGGWGRGSRPVIFVTWQDAEAFAAWASRKTGRQFRLPSEAEWEYAARAGTATRLPWGEQFSSTMTSHRTESWGELRGAPTPVGSYPPSAWGLYDMVGNVSQLTADCSNDNYVGAPDDGSAWKSGDCTDRMQRGGVFDTPPRYLSVTMRIVSMIEFYDSGFRLAEDLR